MRNGFDDFGFDDVYLDRIRIELKMNNFPYVYEEKYRKRLMMFTCRLNECYTLLIPFIYFFAAVLSVIAASNDDDDDDHIGAL
jgi:hypothetical protein